MRVLRSFLLCLILLHSVAGAAETVSVPEILLAGPRVMLVTPGQPKSEWQHWHRWLSNHGSEVVLDASALGDVETLSDQAILDLAKDYPVDVVLIVRKMNTQTLVTRLNLADKVRSSEIVIVPNLVAELPAVAAEARPFVAQAIASAQVASEVEQASLKRGMYHQKVLTSTAPFTFQVGAFEKPLSEKDFYLHIGRTDLAEAYQSSRNTQTLVGIGSGVASALGVGLGFVGLLGGGLDGQTTPMVMAITGGVLVLGGVGGLVWALTADPHPVTHEESLRLMDQFNQEEARRHGVTTARLIPTLHVKF